VRVLLRILALVAIPVGIASFVSVYADEPGLEGRAREVACAHEGGHCRLRLARMARMPWKRAFIFTGGSGGSVQVDCRHSLLLVGDYACARSASVQY
jgi:hypothetical protein